MQEQEKILQMIEQVNPDDTAMLDEIDARVWCWLKDVEFISLHRGKHPVVKYLMPEKDWRLNVLTVNGYVDFKTDVYPSSAFNYTRSRDALKAIRPDGWGVRIKPCPMFPNSRNYCCKISFGLTHTLYNSLPTEELAELHAIIQAIAYERGQENE